MYTLMKYCIEDTFIAIHSPLRNESIVDIPFQCTRNYAYFSQIFMMATVPIIIMMMIWRMSKQAESKTNNENVSINTFILYRNIHNNQSKSNNLLLPSFIVRSSDDLHKFWVPFRLQMNVNKKNVFFNKKKVVRKQYHVIRHIKEE